MPPRIVAIALATWASRVHDRGDLSVSERSAGSPVAWARVPGPCRQRVRRDAGPDQPSAARAPAGLKLAFMQCGPLAQAEQAPPGAGESQALFSERVS
jgi:hypothetical protein